MLLAVTLFPFVCALILFAYFFGRFAGEQDTAKLADAMRQMNYARIIPFPGMEGRKVESPIDGNAPRGEVVLFTDRRSQEYLDQIRPAAREIAKGTSA